jgi:hypothetical protein
MTGRRRGRGLDAGVDELAHTPTERLGRRAGRPARGRGHGRGVDAADPRLPGGGRGGPCDGPQRRGAARGRRRAGLRHRPRQRRDLPGVDPRELDRLAAAGLGRLGALRAATEGAARLLGLPGRLEVGEPAALVLLPADPLVQPEAWRAPTAVLAGGRLVRPGAAAPV